ncbi:response regulator transcription factor [Actinocrinis puniceicyclus]|uniref:Response regulator transcription factor n=1 Tax=Actinocrinis puniceicyclus TaxID=977794 RepID=A0A8J7WNB9_9ACTN|nr:response regulator transcription factor [Actinocrinis puniceicyclus]
MVNEAAGRWPGLDASRGVLRDLSGRELQVLEMMTRGLSSEQIAKALGLSARTVKSHKANISQAIGSYGSATRTVALAFAHGYLRAVPDSGCRRPQLQGRQLQVLARMAEGLSNPQIGGVLGLTENTVKTHIKRLFRTLGVASRVRAVAVGFETGLLPADLPMRTVGLVSGTGRPGDGPGHGAEAPRTCFAWTART